MTAVDELRWTRPDSYHLRSECGRYTVARVSLGEADVYVAWHAERPARELGSSSIPVNSTDERRLNAINAMKLRCAEHALLHVEPKAKAA